MFQSAMIATVVYPHISKSSGEPAHLEQHPRTRVSMIVTDYLGRGWSAEEIVLHYPYLTMAEVHAALGYYHDHQAEIDRELAEEWTTAEQGRTSAPLTPLLAKLRARKTQPA